MSVRVRRRYVDLPHGQVHLAEAGPDGGRPVVLLHQTPRSVDEYRDVLPLLAAAGLRAVAVDTPGFGASDPLPAPSVETLAAAVGDAVAGLGPAVLAGHHTGGVLAVELAATRPRQVAGLVLSSTPLVDAAFRGRPPHGVDDVEPADDGTHLLALWRGRAPFYPPGRRDLLERFVRDALTAGELAHEGHALVRRYAMEDRLPTLTAPVLLLAAPEDPFGAPNTARMAEALPAAGRPRPVVVEVPGGTVPLPDQCPEEYAAAVVRFTAGLP
ncbi:MULTISPECIES: alpha/beta fold hydrolase [unclassified Geodermatophilus]